MFADGSTGYAHGYADVPLAVLSNFSKSSPTVPVRLHVLKDLKYDVLLDETIVDYFEIFKENTTALLSKIKEGLPAIATVIRLSGVEKRLLDAKEALKRGFRSGVSNSSTAELSTRPKSSNAQECTGASVPGAEPASEAAINQLEWKINQQAAEWVRKRKRFERRSYAKQTGCKLMKLRDGKSMRLRQGRFWGSFMTCRTPAIPGL